MSTPVVHFDENDDNSSFGSHNIGWGATKLYLMLSLPLVALTLLAWWCFSLRAKQKERMELKKNQADY